VPLTHRDPKISPGQRTSTRSHPPVGGNL